MLHTVKELHDFTVGASDGEIGEVKDVYFDDERWAIRYMVVEAGGWLSGRKVLISPISVRDVDWDDEVLNVKLSQQQVRDSPSVDTDKPVSRQHEIDYYNYYGYNNYWEGANLWGLAYIPFPGSGRLRTLRFPRGNRRTMRSRARGSGAWIGNVKRPTRICAAARK